ncbi:hypothetical protein QBC46DRAFT_347180 [Diplogelasinospora grovesii]|uniref:Uncharacterized protein n=1 Tax=Diplogelasinospora grovesii TaxID=303347 RepID=A0AAN6RYT0_9PEZI|nr:hypothetical protein QBC46DRAFT_347180 [Diplogelasinospora grovesii]
MADLEEGVTMSRQAVGLTPQDHPSRAMWLNGLGNWLLRRFERTGKMADLEESCSVLQQAVESTPCDHPDRVSRFYNLGRSLQSRYERTGEVANVEEASKCLLNAWHCQPGSPLARIKAAARCLKLLARQNRVDIAIQLGKDVIDLLPIVNTGMLERNDQQFVVSTFAGVAAELCALLLESNEPADALDYLERGRAVIIGQLVAGPERQLRDEANAPLRAEQDTAAAQVRSRRREAVGELDACIREIRGIVGFERFLLGQTVAEMQDCASAGTVVVINIAEIRSDAILVSPTGVVAQGMDGPEIGTGPEEQGVYLEYLSWLWEACVRQVLVEVGGGSDLTDGLPRIWWLGTGLASSMPFHAAGTHADGSTENTFSRAISSYTPSIKALGYARHRARATENARGSLLIAAMPTTPGNGSTPDAEKPKLP